MISGDFEVQEIDASMVGLEEAAGKFELSPELNSDARDTWTGCRPSFPLSSASSLGALMVPEQAAPELGASGSSVTPVMGAVVQGAARRRRTSCERCRIKKLKCPPNCPTLAVEPMALMPESAGGEPSVAQASSVPTRRLSSRAKAPRKAYPESLERREKATGKRRLELGAVFEEGEEVEEEEEGVEGGEEAEEEGGEEGEGEGEGDEGEGEGEGEEGEGEQGEEDGEDGVDGEGEACGGEGIDWEHERDVRCAMLRGMLDFLAGEDGIDPRDDETIDYIMRARGVDAKEQYEKLFELCTLVVGLRPDPDPDFGSSGSPSVGPESAEAELLAS